MALTKREQVLQLVKAYVAEDGSITNRTWRLYLDNRISYQAFNKAVQAGLKAHKEREG